MAELIQFAKYEGLGNDFVLIDDPLDRFEVTARTAVAICDRRLGIGADGLIVLRAARDASNAGRMRYFNRDGGEAEMCGNGVRCVAKHLCDRHGIGVGPFGIETGAGVVRCRIAVQGDGVSEVEVEVGVPRFGRAAVGAAASGEGPFARTAGDRALSFEPVSMGNPHIVTFDEAAEADRDALGPALERDPAFPDRVNVGFARIEAPGRMTLHVYERGCGFTRACGTGACAAVAAAGHTGRAPWGTSVAVTLPGGVLEVTAPGPDRPVLMRGPARRVFEGTFVMRHLIPGPRE